MATRNSEANRTGIKAKKLSEEVFADKMLRNIRKSPALMTHEQMYEYEKGVQTDSGIARRGALAVLTQPGAKLIDGIYQDRETAVAMAAMYELISVYHKDLEGLTKLVDVALARLIVALANRTDMNEILAEGRRSIVTQEGSHA
jgi:hypothetical protein